MAEHGGKSPPKGGGAPKKAAGGGFWDFVGGLLSNVNVEIGVGKPGRPRGPSSNPTDPVERMQPVREERKEAYEETVYRKTDGADGTAPAVRLDRGRRTIARSIDSRMGAASDSRVPQGAGAPLSRDVRAKMEPKLGGDLSDVRVHTSGDSAAAARDLNAKAFTVGSDVHFGSGQFQPGSKEGDRLIAHELTHVVQGQRSGIQRKAQDATHDDSEHGEQNGVSDPNEPAEKEADAKSEEVADSLHGGEGKKGSKGKEATAHEKSAPISAKLDTVGRKIYASQRAAAPAQPPPGAQAPAAEATVNVEPIVGKLEQAIAMFTLWKTRGTSPVADQVLAALNTAKAGAQQVKTAQDRKTPPTELKPMKQQLADQLQHIQGLDPGYQLFSIGNMAMTVKNAKKTMEPVAVQFTCGRRLAPLMSEYKQQLQMQQDGINAQTCQSWLNNRDQFLARQAAGGNGRSPVGTQMQSEYNRRSGSGRSTNTAAPHHSDQIAGGHADPTGAPVNADINSSIGGQWPDKIAPIDAKARAVPAIEQLFTQMNVHLTVQPA